MGRGKFKDFNFEQYFIPNLIKGYEKDIGFIIEIERIVNDINSLRKIYSQFDISKLSEKELERNLEEYDTTLTILLNIMSSHIREAIHLFYRFSKTNLWRDLYQWIKDNGIIKDIFLKELNKVLEEYKNEKGFLKDALIPLRNITFHYKEENAKEWFEGLIEDSKYDYKIGKMFFRIFDKKSVSLKIGKEYNNSLNWNYLVFEGNSIANMFENLDKLRKIQDEFLYLGKYLFLYLTKNLNKSEGAYESRD